jgi:hypothetical protein
VSQLGSSGGGKLAAFVEAATVDAGFAAPAHRLVAITVVAAARPEGRAAEHDRQDHSDHHASSRHGRLRQKVWPKVK